MMKVNNYEVNVYQSGEVQITIPQKTAQRFSEDSDLPVYLRIADLKAMLKLAEDSV